MLRHEMDSSDGDDDDDDDLSLNDYTTTPVLLGYASKEPTEDDISQLGGHPTWLDEGHPPSASLATCKICNGVMSLLLQLNGDLPVNFPGHERRLWLFACAKRGCQRREGSVRAIRGVRRSLKPREGKEKRADMRNSGQVTEKMTAQNSNVMRNNVGEILFGATPFLNSIASNPFSTSAPPTTTSATPPKLFHTQAVTSPSNPFSYNHSSLSTTLAAIPPQRPDPRTDLSEDLSRKATIASPPAPPRPGAPATPWPAKEDLPRPYPQYYLDADYETLTGPSPSASLQTTRDVDGEVNTSNAAAASQAEKDDPSAFESQLDRTFQRFADRMAQNPLQVLRYEFGGLPLLCSRGDAIGRLFTSHVDSPSSLIPHCDNCGAERVFELQLTPHAIVELEDEETADIGAFSTTPAVAQDQARDEQSKDETGMEWGTVILAVCSRDCFPAPVPDRDGKAEGGGGGGGGKGEEKETAHLAEWAGVQWEEALDLSASSPIPPDPSMGKGR